MRHIYLSPHLDDAVLSCGGAIHRQAAAGEPVLVVGLFAGEMPPGAPLSSFALVQHGYWGNPPQPMALRRAEDTAALALLGAEVLHLDYFDAVYRASADGQWLYPDVKALYGDVHPHDPLALEGSRELADHLGERIRAAGETTVYAPLTAGRHVDHQVVHAAARRLMEQGYRLAFYEDYPYAQQPEVVKAALASVGGERWSAEIRGLDPLDLAAKVSAVGYYHTQMSVLFGGAEGMPSPIWTFAATRSPDAALAERIWWPG